MTHSSSRTHGHSAVPADCSHASIAAQQLQLGAPSVAQCSALKWRLIAHAVNILLTAASDGHFDAIHPLIQLFADRVARIVNSTRDYASNMRRLLRYKVSPLDAGR